MSMTTIDETNKKRLHYYDGNWTMNFMQPTLRFVSNDITKGKHEDLGPEDIILISKEKKILISLNIGLYNFYYHTVSLLLSAHKEDPEAIMVLDMSGVQSELDQSYYKFIFQLLDDLKINYILVDPRKANKMYINNFYIIVRQTIGPKDTTLLYETMKRYVKNKDVVPHKRVYISRKYIAPREFKNAKPGLNFNSDNRIIDEYLLEQDLVRLGFEPVYPEEFLDFTEQINFFYEVDTLISLTSSGISNICFMQPGGTIIELVTPLVMALGNPNGEESIDCNESIHHLYHAMAYNKGHMYIGVPNFDRQPETIIKTILSNKNILGNKQDE